MIIWVIVIGTYFVRVCIPLSMLVQIGLFGRCGLFPFKSSNTILRSIFIFWDKVFNSDLNIFTSSVQILRNHYQNICISANHNSPAIILLSVPNMLLSIIRTTRVFPSRTYDLYSSHQSPRKTNGSQGYKYQSCAVFCRRILTGKDCIQEVNREPNTINVRVLYRSHCNNINHYGWYNLPNDMK